MTSKSKPQFCIDTSAFSKSWHRHYEPDHFPSLWVEFDKSISSGLFVIPETVYDELLFQKDALSNWIKARKSKLIIPTDGAFLAEVARISNLYPKLCQHTKDKEVADPYVVALAKIHNLIVVTEEGGKKFKIPDVCLREAITCQPFATTIRQLGWRF